MARCIYCLRDDKSTTFSKREHVLIASLGSFTPVNPTIQGDLVCDNCNGNIFSPLETEFIEDSYEGVMGKMLDLDGSGSVVIRNKNFKMEKTFGLGDAFFDQMFPFFKYDFNLDKRTVVFKRQVKFKTANDGYHIYLPEALEKISIDTAKHKRLKDRLSKLGKKDIMIFAENDAEVGKIIELLKKFGVNYKQGNSNAIKPEPNKEYKLDLDLTVTINVNIARVLAKIAFNYFAFCTLRDNKKEILYSPNFDFIRNFIFAGKGYVKQVITSITDDEIYIGDKLSNQRVVAHFLLFVEENGYLIARMSFFGLPAKYKIILGKLPSELKHPNFGCGHCFNPYANEVLNLSQTPKNNPTEEDIKLSFGLLKRDRVI